MVMFTVYFSQVAIVVHALCRCSFITVYYSVDGFYGDNKCFIDYLIDL